MHHPGARKVPVGTDSHPFARVPAGTGSHAFARVIRGAHPCARMSILLNPCAHHEDNAVPNTSLYSRPLPSEIQKQGFLPLTLCRNAHQPRLAQTLKTRQPVPPTVKPSIFNVG